MPDHPVPQALVSLLGRPIINTTAKLAGRDAFSDPRDIQRYFKDQIAFVIDATFLANDETSMRAAIVKIGQLTGIDSVPAAEQILDLVYYRTRSF